MINFELQLQTKNISFLLYKSTNLSFEYTTQGKIIKSTSPPAFNPNLAVSTNVAIYVIIITTRESPFRDLMYMYCWRLATLLSFGFSPASKNIVFSSKGESPWAKTPPTDCLLCQCVLYNMSLAVSHKPQNTRRN